MYRSIPRLVRSQGGFLKGVFGGKADKEAVKSLTVEEREKLRSALPSIRARESKQVSASPDSIADFDADELIDSRIDTDAIRARGFLKYSYNYTPASSVKTQILGLAGKVLGANTENVEGFKFEEGDNSVKFEILKKIGQEIGHWPTNGKLVHFESISDVIQFYETPVKNITKYAEIARDESKPKNVNVLEQAVRFHPEDTDLYHGGVTAFPGTGGEVLSLRQKRLLRQYQPKKEWFDYEDQTFDYSRPEKDMPWDSEVANQMDRHTDKRYNVKTKQFTRIRN